MAGKVELSGLPDPRGQGPRLREFCASLSKTGCPGLCTSDIHASNGESVCTSCGPRPGLGSGGTGGNSRGGLRPHRAELSGEGRNVARCSLWDQVIQYSFLDAPQCLALGPAHPKMN